MHINEFCKIRNFLINLIKKLLNKVQILDKVLRDKNLGKFVEKKCRYIF
jgi:hypothetical protein